MGIYFERREVYASRIDIDTVLKVLFTSLPKYTLNLGRTKPPP